MSTLMPYMSDQEVKHALNDYDNFFFDRLPDWLQHELQSRSLTFNTREPTRMEKHQAYQDGIDHRLTQNTETIDDIKHKYGIKD